MGFTQSIWKTESQNTQIRADYYESLWKMISSKNTGENYLDIGAGDLTNTVTFGKHFQKVYAIDANISNNAILKAQSILPNINISSGDAHNLTYRDDMFDVVTMISVIEHVEKPEQALKEAVRVLRPDGELIIQILNKYFPIEPHTGLPFVYYIPKSIREWLLQKLGYRWYLDNVREFPTPKEVSVYLTGIADLKAMKEIIIPWKLSLPVSGLCINWLLNHDQSKYYPNHG